MQRIPKDWLALPIILCLPVIMVVVNDEWIFSPIGALDPWIDLSLGLDYNSLLYDKYYKVGRIVWFTLQIIPRSLFSPITAQYVIQLGVDVASIALCYAVCLRLFNPLTAGLVGVMLAVFPGRYLGGADYYYHFGEPLTFVVLLLLVHSAQQANIKRWGMYTGAAFGCLTYTNLLSIFLLPSYLLFFWVHSHLSLQGKKHRIKTLFRYALLGGLLATVVLMFISKLAFGRRWFFFGRLLKTALRLAKNDGWHRPWSSGWYLNTPYFAILTAGFALAVATTGWILWRHKQKKDALSQVQVLGLAAHGAYSLGFLVFFIKQTLGNTMLQPDYIASTLFPLLFLSMATHVFLLQQRIKAQVGYGYVLGSAVLALASLYAFYPITTALLASLPVALFYQVIVFVFVLAAAVWLLGKTSAPIALWVLLGGYAVLLPVYINRVNILPTACPLRKDFYQTTLRVREKQLAGREPSETIWYKHPVFVWTDGSTENITTHPECPRTPLLQAVQSYFYIVAGEILREPFSLTEFPHPKEISAKYMQRFLTQKNPLLLLFTKNPEHVDAFKKRLAQEGVGIKATYDPIRGQYFTMPMYAITLVR